jgi:hypothetical protein
MVVVLGALIFAVLIAGFSILGAVPLMFAVLGYGLFREYRARTGPAPTKPEAIAVPEEKEPERPRVMVAGRSRPIG